MANDNGIGESTEMSHTVSLTVIAFIAISLYNVVELTFSIFLRFKRRNGLYFWSLLVATWGIAPYALGFMFKFYDVISVKLVYVTFIAIGWCCMVTGQSVVLYSRLHLVIQNESRLRWVLAMIIVDAIICHIPIVILLYGSNSGNPTLFVTAYSIYEKIQITIFFIQETIISGLYVWETVKVLRPGTNLYGRSTQHVMAHLIYINIIIIALDIAVLGIEYAGYYNIQTTFKGAVYSIKLKMEFNILNRLVELVQGTTQGSSDRQPSNRHRSTTGGIDSSRGKGSKFSGASTNKSFSNNAFATQGEAAGEFKLEDISVITTTEVTVERLNLTEDEISPDLSKDRQLRIIGRERPQSTTSSEEQFAHRGY